LIIYQTGVSEATGRIPGILAGAICCFLFDCQGCCLPQNYPSTTTATGICFVLYIYIYIYKQFFLFQLRMRLRPSNLSQHNNSDKHFFMYFSTGAHSPKYSP
jgi:hypothetical protein